MIRIGSYHHAGHGMHVLTIGIQQWTVRNARSARRIARLYEARIIDGSVMAVAA